MVRRIKPVFIGSHPSLYAKMEELRKMYQDQAGIRLSQIQVTNLISKRISMPRHINITGDKNVKKKKR